MSTANNTEISNITFAEEVTNKVRKLIMDAMPEAKIQGILNKEYEKYFVDEHHHYNGTKPSPFSRLVEAEIKNQMEKRIKVEVMHFLGNLVMNPEQQAKEVMAAIAPAVLEAMTKAATIEIARTFVDGLRQSLQQSMTLRQY